MRAVIIVCGALLLGQDPAAEDQFQKAELARKEARDAEAKTAFKKLLSRAPDHLEGHLGYQKLLQSQGKEEALLAEYEDLLEKRGAPIFYYLYGRLLHDPEREDTLYRKGLADAPDNFELRIALGDALRRNRKMDEAIREYRRALEKHPSALREHLAYIKLMVSADRTLEMIEEYRRRGEHNPKDHEALLLYGVALVTSGLSERARRPLEQALKLSPRNPYVLAGLGVRHAKERDWKRAEEKWQAALDEDAYYVGALHPLAILYLFVNRNERGRELLKTAIRLEPANATLHSDLAADHLIRMDYNQAEASLKEALRLDPTTDSAVHRMGLLFKARGNYAQAAHWFEKAVDLSPHNADYYAALGKAYEQLGKKGQARAALDKSESIRKTGRGKTK